MKRYSAAFPEMTRTVKLAGYSVGADALNQLPSVCLAYGHRGVCIGGNKAIQAARHYLEAACFGKIELDFLPYGGEASEENISALIGNELVSAADFILGVGGGKALDTAKAVAMKLDKPVFAIPTIAATCAATTAISILYNSDGSFHRIMQLGKPPQHVFISTRIIAEAPVQYLWAGIGDTLAKHYEVLFSSKNDELPHTDALASQISYLCVGPQLKYGERALEDARRQVASFALEQVAFNIIISTGYISTVVDSRYNSAVAHALFYGLTTLPQIEEKHLHGEVVAYGVLVQCLLDNNLAEFQRLLPFYKALKLPTNLRDLDVELSRESLAEVLEKTLANQEMDYIPYPVDEDMIYEAMSALEKMQ